MLWLKVNGLTSQQKAASPDPGSILPLDIQSWVSDETDNGQALWYLRNEESSNESFKSQDSWTRGEFCFSHTFLGQIHFDTF